MACFYRMAATLTIYDCFYRMPTTLTSSTCLYHTSTNLVVRSAWARPPIFCATAVCCYDRGSSPDSALSHSQLALRAAMPAKIAQRAMAPKVIKDAERVQIHEVSIEQDSGWRDLDDKRVKELLANFLDGDYGANILRKPTLLWEGGAQGALKLSGSGYYQLSDGKSTFAALKLAQARYAEELKKPEAEQTVAWSEKLLDAFGTAGVDVQVVEFTEHEHVKVYNVLAHDSESNKYRPTAIQSLIETVNMYRNKIPGGDWKKTQQTLEGLYGPSKRTFVYRMIMCAMGLNEAIAVKLKELEVPNFYINENPYFLGHGANAVKKLSDAGRMTALDLLKDGIDNGAGLSADVFMNEYCAPLKHAEKWVALKRKQYGAVADGPAFKRVTDFLMTNRGRLAVFGCMRAGIRLEGVSEEQPGIEHCRILIKDLDTARARPADGRVADTTAATVASAPAEAGADVGDESCDAMLVDEADVDPVKAVVSNRVEAAMSKINIYDTLDSLTQCLVAQVVSSQKIVILVDAPTSRSRVLMTLLDWVGEFLSKCPSKLVRVLVPCGGRLDLLSAANVRLTVSASTLNQFTVLLTAQGAQQLRKKVKFMQYGMSSDLCDGRVGGAGPAPNTIAAQAARAKPGECTRLRCMSRECSLRPAGQVPDAGAENTAELDQDDLEYVGVDDCVEEGGEDAADDTADVLVPPPERRNCVTDLWPFAFGRDFYKELIDAVAPQESIAHLVVLTTSAHPGSWLAGFDGGMNVHVYLDRVKQHCKNHGLQIFKHRLSANFEKTERARADVSAKRVRTQDLSFLSLDAPLDQPVQFEEIPVDKAISGWRGGYNSWPPSDVLEKGVISLMSKELEDHHLAVVHRTAGSRTCLITKRALKEGDTVIVARSLLFSSAQHVRDFMNVEGHSALLEGPLIKVTGLDRKVEPRSLEVFAVLVGAARLLCDYRGIRKWANAAIVPQPNCGPNDGFLIVRVQTHNGCGLAAGAEVLLDLGERYIPGNALHDPPAKKIQGRIGPAAPEAAQRAGGGGARRRARRNRTASGL